jgi:hypothetical protein
MDKVTVAGADDEAREMEEEDNNFWYHGIDEVQHEIIEKARRQYERKTGRHISRHGMVKRIIGIFYQDMDIIDASMGAKERAEAWAKALKHGL